MRFKARAPAASLLAMLLAGAIASAGAYAEPGPYWFHRAVGGKGNGTKLAPGAIEQIKGEGGKQTLTGEVGGSKLTVVAAGVAISGSYYNNADQAQSKLAITYKELILTEPEIKGCEVKIGTGDTVTTAGHMAWKWNGEKKQLEEEAKTAKQALGWIYLPKELAEGAETLPKEQLTTVTLSPCGILNGTYPVKGAQTGEAKPGLEVFSATQGINLTLPEKQHFWNGKAFRGAETGLLFGTQPATNTGESKIKPATQEFALLIGGLKVSVEPIEVKFGNATKASRTVVYKNEGAEEWVVPALVYTVNEGGAGAVTRKNECEGKKVAPGASCNVVVEYSVSAAENYKAEMKLTPAATVKVQAEA